MYLIDRVGRKSLLIVSGAGMCAFHAITALSLYNTENTRKTDLPTSYLEKNSTYQNIRDSSWQDIEEEGDDVHSTYLPLIGLIGFYLTFAIGTGAVPMVILGEVFPQSVKGTAISLVNCSMWVLNFAMSKMFFLMNDVLGMYGTFIFFSCSSLIMSLYVYIFLPETKSKTLNQIQRKLEGNKKIIVDS